MPINKFGRKRWVYSHAALFSASPPPIIIYEYNSIDSNLTFITNNVSSALETSGSNRHAFQNTATLRPHQGLLTGNTAMVFVKANNDSLTVSNARNYSNSVSALGWDGFLVFNSFPSTHRIATVFSGNGAASVSLVTLNVLNTGLFRLTTRRSNTDSTVNFDTTTLAFTQNLISYFSAEIDFTTSTANFRINDATESVFKAVTWNSGTGLTESLPAASDQIIGRDSGNNMTANVGLLRHWSGNMPSANTRAKRIEFFQTFGAPLQTVAFNEPTGLWRDHMYIRNPATNNANSILIRGTVTFGSDANIELRRIDSNVLHSNTSAWIDIGPSVGGVWSYYANNEVPAGSWYYQARKVGEVDQSIVTDSNRIGVGDRIMFHGQSPIRQWWGDDSRKVPYPVNLPGEGNVEKNMRWSGQGWFNFTRAANNSQNNTGTLEAKIGPLNNGSGGNPLTKFGELWRDRRGYPLGALAYAIGSSGLAEWYDDGTGFNWNFMVANINLEGGPGFNYQAVTYVGGEEELHGYSTRGYNEEMAFANMKSNLTTFITQHRNHTGDPNLPFFISLLSTTVVGGDSDDVANGIRRAQLWMIDNYANTFMSHNPLDRNVADGDSQHVSVDSYETVIVHRFEQNYARWQGLTAIGANGPRITGGTAAAGSNLISLTVTHDGGTTLWNNANATVGYGFSQFGSHILVNSVQKLIVNSNITAGVINIRCNTTFSAADNVAVYHQGGHTMNVAQIVYDNTTLRCPLQPTRGWFSVTAA